MLSYDPDDHTIFMCVEICTYDTYLTICLKSNFIRIDPKTNGIHSCTLILFYKQHMIKETSWTFLYFIWSLLIFFGLVFERKFIVVA